MIRERKNIEKTEYSDLFLYNSDASEVLSFTSGMARFQMYLPYGINNGVYDLCTENKYFSDYLLFAVNQCNYYIDCPGIYAAFSPYGINFTIWTQYGKFCLLDTVTHVTAGESFIVEFCWDSTKSKLGKGATMAIFVNGACTASGNFLLGAPSMSGFPMFVFDSKYVDFNMKAGIQDVMFFSEISPDKFDSVKKITNTRFSTDEMVLCGRNAVSLYIDWFGGSVTRFDDLSCFSVNMYGVAIDDITGNFFLCSSVDSSTSGKLVKFDVSESKVTASLHGLKLPRSVCVIQKDSMDYPRNSYYDQSECDGVLFISGNSVIKTNSMLVKQEQSSIFNNPSCVKYNVDRTVWVSDTGNNCVKHMSSDLSELLLSIDIDSPTFLCTTVKNDMYVYSSTLRILYLIKDGKIKKSAAFTKDVVGFDVDHNSRIVVVAFSSGIVRTYDNKLNFIKESHPATSISAIHVRRGYHQDSYIIVNELESKIICARVSNPYIIVSEVEYDSDLYFNGSVCASARNIGVSAELEGFFDLRYGLDKSAVKNISAMSYKVIQRDVDLTDGGSQGAYFDLMNIDSDTNPTDPKGNVVKSFEVDK
jgi:hypothetical protein